MLPTWRVQQVNSVELEVASVLDLQLQAQGGLNRVLVHYNIEDAETGAVMEVKVQ